MKWKYFLKNVCILGMVGVLSYCATPPATVDVFTPRENNSKAHSEPVKLSVRPGLGTQWGEHVDAAVNYTQFARQEGKPSALETLFYNDKEGVKSMLKGRAFQQSEKLAKSSNQLVEWGIRSRWGYVRNVESGGRRFVVGKQGAQYSIVVKNVCDSRLEIVLSVDGLDVMDGRSASVKKRGYIILPGKTLEVRGFRVSERAVAAFKFFSVDQSYSQKKHGTSRNVGVIGMAVFSEKGISPWKYSRGEIQQRSGARAFAEAPLLRAR